LKITGNTSDTGNFWNILEDNQRLRNFWNTLEDHWKINKNTKGIGK
jgi:hypothetical protein